MTEQTLVSRIPIRKVNKSLTGQKGDKYADVTLPTPFFGQTMRRRSAIVQTNKTYLHENFNAVQLQYHTYLTANAIISICERFTAMRCGIKVK